MALLEGCRHSLEVSVPVQEVETETGRVLEDIKKKARIPGFRPGKVPASLLRKQFESDIRRRVLENLIPRHLNREFEQQDLKVVGTPDIREVHFEQGEPLRFKAEFEVVPEIELGDYVGISVPYHDPEVTDEDVNRRIEELREQKADYINVDARPIGGGDYAVLSLESVGGVEGEPVRNNELMLEIGGEDTLPAFSENLRGMSPGEEKDFDVTYPEDFGQGRLAGKTIRFHAVVKGIRRKELPEPNDDFAQDLGDFRTMDELRDSLRKSIFAQRQHEAQNEAKNRIVEKLVDAHDFPAPEVFIDRQIRNRTEQAVRAMAGDKADLKNLRIDWEKAKETQRDKALREVKASLLLSRIAEREAISATRDEVDREVERVARQQRETFAAVRLRFEKDGTLGRIASHIETEKTLNFLFEQARKESD